MPAFFLFMYSSNRVLLRSCLIVLSCSRILVFPVVVCYGDIASLCSGIRVCLYSCVLVLLYPCVIDCLCSRILVLFYSCVLVFLYIVFSRDYIRDLL